MQEGWKCPNCGKAHPPDVKTCPEPAQAVPPVYVPVYVPYPQPVPTVPGLPYVTCGSSSAPDFEWQSYNGTKQ